MFDRINNVCPSCGSNEVTLCIIQSHDASLYGIPLRAYCLDCDLTRAAYVDWRLAHFVLRVASSSNPSLFDHSGMSPWRWSAVGVLGSLKALALRRQVSDAFSVCSSGPSTFLKQKSGERSSVIHFDLVEHRVFRPLVKAILCSSGDLVTSLSYFDHAECSVGQPLAS